MSSNDITLYLFVDPESKLDSTESFTVDLMRSSSGEISASISRDGDNATTLTVNSPEQAMDFLNLMFDSAYKTGI